MIPHNHQNNNNNTISNNPLTNSTNFVISTSLFVVSSLWYLSSLKKRCDRQKKKRESSSALDDHGRSIVGRRGARAVTPELPYVRCFIESMQNSCDPTTNPEGHIALCVAENKLISEPLAYRLMRPETSITAFSNSVAYEYVGFLGLPPAREAVAYFLTRRFLRREEREGGGKTTTTGGMMMNGGSDDGSSSPTHHRDDDVVDPENVVLGSGCGGLLNHLFFVLAEEGDAVLIPAPYYAKFDSDITVVAGCVPYPVHSKNPNLGPSKSDLQAAAHKAEKEGLRVKILLLNNPNNPLGVIYPADVIRDAIDWARGRGMHTIVNEIYALSTHHRDGHGFKSVINILNNKLDDDVHFLWGMSKDFGACGFRIGILYTTNKSLLLALANLNAFSSVSQPMQMILASLLTDDAFVDSFLEQARMRLRKSYDICVRKLQDMVIPFVPAQAGLFVYVDFSSLLPTDDFEGERRLATLVQDVARIVMAPGESMRERRPGMFRISYACVTPEILEIALERLNFFVGKVRKIDWDDLSSAYLEDVMKHGMRRRTSFDATKWTKGQIEALHF